MAQPNSNTVFSLAIHSVTSKVKSDLNVWYLDDGCIGGDARKVLRDATTVRKVLSTIGLEINNSKYSASGVKIKK